MTFTIYRPAFSSKGVILTCLCLTMASFGHAQNAPAPEVMAQQPLPDHERGATLDGKTALDHAAGLSRSNASQSRAALQALARMGVDALPARDIVRGFAEDPSAGMGLVGGGDDLKVAALSVLAAMRAPESNDLLRQKLLDPDYLTGDRAYETLLVATGQVGLDHDTLTQDMISLAEMAPSHASRLMVIDALADPVQAALNEAVFKVDYDQGATHHFLANLQSLNFLDASDKLAYVAAHRDLASQEARLMQDALAGIGTQTALDLALQIDGENEVEPHRTISRFADGPMPKSEITDRFLAAAQAETSEQDIQRVLSSLESILGDQTESAYSTSMQENHRRLFVEAMGVLITDGSSDNHRAAGIRRQVLFIQRNDNVPLDAALDPIFDLLDAQASPSTHNAAARALVLNPARIASSDPDYFVERSLSLLWDASTPELAEIPVNVLNGLMRSPDYAELVVDKIAGQIDLHLDRWAMNPATAVATTAGTIRNLEFTPVREKAGEIMGKALTSPALDMEYLGPHLARGGGAIAVLDGNTVEGVIAVLTPSLFAEEKPKTALIDSFLQPMLGRPAWLQRDPEARAKWIAFLQEVAALDDPDFNPFANEALQALQ